MDVGAHEWSRFLPELREDPQAWLVLLEPTREATCQTISSHTCTSAWEPFTCEAFLSLYRRLKAPGLAAVSMSSWWSMDVSDKLRAQLEQCGLLAT